MNLALAEVEEAAYSRTDEEDIKGASEEADLADVTEVYLAVALEEEETVGAVDNIIEWYDTIMDHNLRFTRHMTSLIMNSTCYLRQKE